MLKAIGFCTTVFASVFHRGNPVLRLEGIIERGFYEHASIRDYMEAGRALNLLEIEIQKLKRNRDIDQLDQIYAWTRTMEGDGFIQSRLRNLRP